MHKTSISLRDCIASAQGERHKDTL